MKPNRVLIHILANINSLLKTFFFKREKKYGLKLSDNTEYSRKKSVQADLTKLIIYDNDNILQEKFIRILDKNELPSMSLPLQLMQKFLCTQCLNICPICVSSPSHSGILTYFIFTCFKPQQSLSNAQQELLKIAVEDNNLKKVIKIMPSISSNKTSSKNNQKW